MYLEVIEDEGVFLLNGEDYDDAYLFYVEQTRTADGLTAYKLSYGKDNAAFLARNEKCSSGKNSLQIGVGESVQFVLTNDEDETVSFSDWGSEPCYVKIVSSSMKGCGYMGYNQKSNLVECVTDINRHDDGTMWLLCMTERLPTEASGGFAPAGPRKSKTRPPITVPPNIDAKKR